MDYVGQVRTCPECGWEKQRQKQSAYQSKFRQQQNCIDS